jgi:hypothetical protein
MNEFATKSIKFIRAGIVEREQMIAWLEKHGDKFDSLAAPGSIYSASLIDFDNLTHPQIIEVIKTFPGKWDKTPSSAKSDRIDYITEFDGVRLRCWQGEPPPSCKIVEVMEDVPAQPASQRLVRKIVCPEGVAA